MRVYNFSAGPGMLPLEVLQEAGASITDYQGSGMSVMEMSHRSKWYEAINDECLSLVRELMNVPENYHVIFVQGGASTQFEAVPLNLLKTGKADYIVTGNFAKKAYKEAQKYGDIRLVASSEDKKFTYIPKTSPSDFRKDALASALHVYYLQRKYPHAEMSLSCPRLRPIINNDKINPLDVGEKELCQVLCAYRIFMPFVGITVSSRESKSFRDGIVKIAATKVSAGVSTGIGDHESKYTGKEAENAEGDEQFEINDDRSFETMYEDMSEEGLQPVLNDYLYV